MKHLQQLHLMSNINKSYTPFLELIINDLFNKMEIKWFNVLSQIA